MDNLDAWSIVLILVGGFIAGSINALAGYGSVITLSLLMDVVGLPPTIANATNRIGVLGNGLGSTYGFYRGGKLDLRKGGFILSMTILGAIVGILLALAVSNEAFKQVFQYLVIVLLITILINPKRWLHPNQSQPPVNRWVSGPIYLIIGFYGGFIQMGMGLVFLASAVLLSHIPILKANALKVLVVSLYTVISLGIFAYYDMLRWLPGLLLALGQITGGYLTASYASRTPAADRYAYWLLIIIVIGITIRTFL